MMCFPLLWIAEGSLKWIRDTCYDPGTKIPHQIKIGNMWKRPGHPHKHLKRTWLMPGTTERMRILIQTLVRHSQRVLEMGQSRGVFHVTFYCFVLIKSFMMSPSGFYKKTTGLSLNQKGTNWKKTEELAWLGNNEEERAQETSFFFLLLEALLQVLFLPHSASRHGATITSPHQPLHLWVNNPWLLA